MKALALGCLVLALFSGCAANVSPQSYSVGSVGQINRTVPATVINAREIDISGTTSLGGATGTAAGAVAGSGAGGGSGRGSVLGAIGGAVIGSMAGAAIEANATKQKGMEYVVETENGNMMSLVQGNDPIFGIGQKVLVLYGSPSRLIADMRKNR